MGTPISGYGPPTTETKAQIGDFYIDQDAQVAYKCTDIINGPALDYGFIDIQQDRGKEYVWKSVNNKIKYADYFCYKGYRSDEVAYLDFSEATSFAHMYAGTYIPELPVSRLDTRSGTKFDYMFSKSSIMYAPELDTRNGTSFSYMFESCQYLVTVPKIDLSLATSVGGMFNTCTALKNLGLYNIRKSINTYSSPLTVDSLVHIIKELCTVTTRQTFTMGSARLAAIANLYCKVVDDTTEKIEMELCESTDEGAMTLADYAALKNWAFA